MVLARPRHAAATLVSVALSLLALCAWPATTSAQESGGSFGGSDFSSDSSSSSSSDFGSSSGGSDFGTSSDFSSSDSSGGGGGGESFGPIFALAMTALFFVFIVAAQRKRSSRRKGRRGGARTKGFVAGLQLAFDWRERAAVQAALERLAASSGDLRTRGGLDRALDKTLAELERRQEAIRLAWYFTDALDDLPACEARFRSLASNERSRYQTEVVRGEADGTVRDDGGDFVARAEEGRGFVVVTILVASRKKPPSAELHLDRTGLGTVMRDLAANTAKTMLALEVIWTPAAENDRMSSAEMQTLFGNLRAVDTLSSAAGVPEIGRVICSYCRAVFAAELGSCPQCGAALRT